MITVLTTSGLLKEDPRSQVLAKRFYICPSDIVLDDPALCDTQHCADDGACAGDLKCCDVHGV